MLSVGFSNRAIFDSGQSSILAGRQADRDGGYLEEKCRAAKQSSKQTGMDK
jgi:hypothetical protein